MNLYEPIDTLKKMFKGLDGIDKMYERFKDVNVKPIRNNDETDYEPDGESDNVLVLSEELYEDKTILNGTYGKVKKTKKVRNRKRKVKRYKKK